MRIGLLLATIIATAPPSCEDPMSYDDANNRFQRVVTVRNADGTPGLQAWACDTDRPDLELPVSAQGFAVTPAGTLWTYVDGGGWLPSAGPGAILASPVLVDAELRGSVDAAVVDRYLPAPTYVNSGLAIPGATMSVVRDVDPDVLFPVAVSFAGTITRVTVTPVTAGTLTGSLAVVRAGTLLPIAEDADVLTAVGVPIVLPFAGASGMSRAVLGQPSAAFPTENIKLVNDTGVAVRFTVDLVSGRPNPP